MLFLCKLDYNMSDISLLNKIQEYNEEHCYQYQKRLDTLEEDKKTLGFTDEDIENLRKRTEEDEKREEKLLNDWVEALPSPYNNEMRALYEEMNERKTLEAKIYKAIDSLEAVIQHNFSDISTWLPNEYELNRTYAYDRVSFSEYMTSLREEIRKETDMKIASQN